MINDRFSALFLIVLLTIPVQLNKFFFVDDSFVLGIPLDYLAITLYSSEIALAALIIFSKVGRECFSRIFKSRKGYLFSTSFLVIYLFISSWHSPGSLLIGAVFTLKILSMAVFSIFVAYFFSDFKYRTTLRVGVYLSLVWQSLLLVLQFVFQRSMGLWFLGERSFDASTVNIAHFDLFGRQMLRPYGTFPHPNVAAAFLLVFLLIANQLEGGKSKTAKVIIGLALAALVLTFSKTAIFLLAAFVIINTKKMVVKLILLIVAIISAFLLLDPSALVPIASIAERLMLSQAALDITMQSPLWGVGTSNFLRSLAVLDLYSLSQTRLLQPVHNVFLLILAENGVVGLAIFAGVLSFAVPKVITRTKIFLFFALLIMLSIDHFLWTVHQGRMLFWLSLGFLLSYQVAIKSPKKLK